MVHRVNRREALLGAAALAACSPEAMCQAQAPPFPMRRGVNLGNALEAPREGDWGYRIEAAHLAAIAAAGFDGVRLPVRWDQHMDARAVVAPAHMARVAEVIGWAHAAGLMVQLDVHHFAALIQNPRTEMQRFMALWRQIAGRFAEAPRDLLLFELLNEPHGRQWDGARLTQLQSNALAIVRESNPERMVVVGPGNWQNIDALARWRPPEGANVAVSVHYYEPHAFTHQNAEWLGDDAPVFGRDWGTSADRAGLREHIARAAAWGTQRGHATHLGEFGVNGAVPIQQRAAWTRTVREACEANGLGWCAWDFAGAFPVWDRERGEFMPLMRDALFA
jgi:endoglucanase